LKIALSKKISKQSVAEKQKLIDFKRQITKDPKAEMHQWDNSFYGAQYKK